MDDVKFEMTLKNKERIDQLDKHRVNKLMEKIEEIDDRTNYIEL